MNTNIDANIRNFKDFLQIYNNLSQKCFKRCVDNFNSRTLEDHEVKCVENCSEKFVKLNHRFLAIYMEYQQIIVNKRIKEAEELATVEQAKQEQTKLEEAKHEPISAEANNSSSTLQTTDLIQQPHEVPIS